MCVHSSMIISTGSPGSERLSHWPEITEHCSRGLAGCGLQAVLLALATQLQELVALASEPVEEKPKQGQWQVEREKQLSREPPDLVLNPRTLRS